MDESGHDHQQAPFEVRGGICVHAKNVWPLTQKIKRLEFFAFGEHLHNFRKSDDKNSPELKGKSLLKSKRFTLASQNSRISHEDRQELSRQLLSKGARKENPVGHELTAYAQAGIYFCDELLRVLLENDATIFASRIPNGIRKPKNIDANMLRKDHMFFYERFDRFLRSKQETGLLIMDQSEKKLDRRYVRALERLFTRHEIAKGFAETIVLSPIFVDSEMSYLFQAADIVLYILSWGYRISEKDPVPPRADLFGLDSGRIKTMVDNRRVTKNGQTFLS